MSELFVPTEYLYSTFKEIRIFTNICEFARDKFIPYLVLNNSGFSGSFDLLYS